MDFLVKPCTLHAVYVKVLSMSLANRNRDLNSLRRKSCRLHCGFLWIPSSPSWPEIVFDLSLVQVDLNSFLCKLNQFLFAQVAWVTFPQVVLIPICAAWPESLLPSLSWVPSAQVDLSHVFPKLTWIPLAQVDLSHFYLKIDLSPLSAGGPESLLPRLYWVFSAQVDLNLSSQVL